jgi:hypothetical protein
MNQRSEQIGFSQRVHLEWLEQTVNLILAGNDQPTIESDLQRILRTKVSVGGHAQRGNREKIITILTKVWLRVPKHLMNLRDDGLSILTNLSGDERMAVHWGMVTAVYPFWGAVASHVGRLLKLQGTCAAAHIQRRVREKYGERETVSRAARRVIRSLVDWRVLKASGTKGVYEQGLSVSLDQIRIVSWLLEASLHARSMDSAHLHDLMEHPCLFPFRIPHVSGERLAGASQQLEFFRQGLDQEVLMLRKVKGS